MSLLRKIASVLWAGIIAYLIALALQGVWTALLVANLRTKSAIPWCVPAMAALLIPAWLWLGGRFAPSRSSEYRRQHLRAFKIESTLFIKAVLAGIVGLVALCGLWIVLAETVEVPTSSLPDLKSYSALMAYSIIGFGAIVGAVLEEAGFRGYAQVMLMRNFRPATAALITSGLFAIGPHPPAHGFLLPKIGFYFLVALLLAAVTELTGSILPAIVVHVLGLAIFFTLIWPKDTSRRLIWNDGAHAWFWIHVLQLVACSALTLLFLRRLSSKSSVEVMAATR